MSLKTRLDGDIKVAMLAGDKVLTTTLKGIKSAFLYAEVEAGKRESGLSDSEALAVLRKEAKKRRESAELYKQGGDSSKAEVELAELKAIEKYMPEMLSEEDVAKAVQSAIEQTGADSVREMGKVIGVVKNKLGDRAEGSVIARITKEKLQ